MKQFQHIAVISRMPVTAQTSNYQIKMESVSTIIDRLLLVPRQQPWKSTGPSGTTTDTTTGTDTGTSTGLGGLGV